MSISQIYHNMFNKRKQKRFEVNILGKLFHAEYALTIVPAPLLDISMSGFSFYSEKKYVKGDVAMCKIPEKKWMLHGIIRNVNHAGEKTRYGVQLKSLARSTRIGLASMITEMQYPQKKEKQQ